jgi:predicted translin family RNA/ssDNA-binding protein
VPPTPPVLLAGGCDHAPVEPPTPPVLLAGGCDHAPFLAQAVAMRAEIAAEKCALDELEAASREIQDGCALYYLERQLGDAAQAAARLDRATEACATRLRTLEPHGDLRFFFGHAAKAMAGAQTFEAFLRTGTLGMRPVASAAWHPLAPGSSASAALEGVVGYLDSEWILGMISAAHEIGRYASARATAGDAASVASAAAVVGALQEALLGFDLRNGPIRKASDSVKYIVRRLEDTLYELSLSADEPTRARAKAPAVALVDAPALAAARAAYEAEDETREGAIKRARDVQKNAKNAIYGLHRADPKAAGQIAQAVEIALEMQAGPFASQPQLRASAFVHGMLEELAEAISFERWLATGTLLARDDPALAALGLDAAEYLGGICDLIGEIGRVAVQKATARDEATVLVARGTALAVQTAALTLGSVWPRRVDGKLGALRTALVKLDQLLYESALLKRSGRRTQQVEWHPEGGAVGGGAGGEE